MKNYSNMHQKGLLMAMGLSLLLFIMVIFIGQALAATGQNADLESSNKTVDLTEAEAGETLHYTILISNTGNISVSNVFMEDVLPAEVMYETDSLTVTAGSNYMTAVYGENSNVITWTGALSAQGYVELSFNGILMDGLTPGTDVVNTAVITGKGSWITRTASTTILEPMMPRIFLPAMWQPLSAPNLQLSAPVNNSQWSASWSDLGQNVAYELEESNSPDFSNSTVYMVNVGVTSQNIVQTSPNIYYYRVRGVLNGKVGIWSNIRSVLVGQLQLSVSRANEFNDWSVDWSSGGSGVTSYELQEAKSQVFNGATSYMVQSERSYDFNQHAPSPDNYYCYRVRAIAAGKLGSWSNIECVVGGYYDDFSDDSTNWDIRRQDTDDVMNLAYYKEKQGEQFFVLEIDGRWDYGIAAPLRRAPEPPYFIEARVRLNEPDNLNSYGFIFGGDWDGTSECPNEDYSSCFNDYYRLFAMRYGDPKHLRIQLKRIDFHEDNNQGRGETLVNFKTVYVGSPSEGFKKWRIDVKEDGEIRLYVNGSYILSRYDTRYIDQPYFGVFASTDEYLGAEPWYDWFRVMPLPLD